MNYFNTFVFVLFISFNLKSQYSSQHSIAEPLVQEAIHSLYNFDFDRAKVLLDSAVATDATHPLPPFLLISTNWLNTQINFGYDSSYNILNNGIDKTIPVYLNLLEVNNSNPELYLYLGSTYGLKARTALAQKNWIDVLYFGYQGLTYINKAKSLDSNLMDIYMPIGIMEYIVCKSSALLQIGANFFNISANCHDGLEHLENAAQKSKYSWVEASNVLSYIYLHIERDFIKAEEYINPLIDLFPYHPHFSYLKGELLAKSGNWNELQEFMPILENFATSSIGVIKDECKLKLTYILALKSYYEGDYYKTIDQITWLQNNYNMEFDWLKGFSHLLRGKCYDIINKRKLAINDYKNVIQIDHFYPEVEEAKLYLKNPFVL